MTVPSSSPVTLVLVGGFLGAGKTTAIGRLAKTWAEAGRRVAVIANDQAPDLVDTATFRSMGLTAAEVTGGCFCCHFDEFVARADELIETHRPDVILAEPVGSCTDLVATVINPLRRYCGDRLTVAPYTVLVDPVRALRVIGGDGPVGLSEKVTYIFRMQQQEASAIAISKVDVLSAGDRQRVRAILTERFPGRPVLEFSAVSGEGFEALQEWLVSGSTGVTPLMDLDYDIYAEGEAALGWINSQVRFESGTPMELDALVMDLAQRLQTECRTAGLEVAHAKFSLATADASAMASIVSNDAQVSLARASGRQGQELTLTCNLRVLADPAVLADLVRECTAAWGDEHGLLIVEGAGQAFRPARPEPTHRLMA